MLLIHGNKMPIVINPNSGPPTMENTLLASCAIELPRNWTKYAIRTTARPNPIAEK